MAIKIVKKVDLLRAEQERRERLAATQGVTTAREDRDILSSLWLSKEIELLMRLDHPNIVRLFQVIETQEEYYVVM